MPSAVGGGALCGHPGLLSMGLHRTGRELQPGGWISGIGAFFITLVEELLWTRRPYLHLTAYGVILLLVGFYLPGGLVRLLSWGKV